MLGKDAGYLSVSLHDDRVGVDEVAPELFGYDLPYRGLARARHPGQNDISFIEIYLVKNAVGQLNSVELCAHEMLRRKHRLSHQHIQPARRGDAAFAGRQHKRCAQRIVHSVDHSAESGEAVEVDRTAEDVRVHPARGGVDQHVGVGVIGISLLVGDRALAPGAADTVYLLSAQTLAHRRGGAGGAAGAEDQRLLVPQFHAGALDERPHTAEIGVVSAEDTVTVDDGVHRADGLSLG